MEDVIKYLKNQIKECEQLEKDEGLIASNMYYGKKSAYKDILDKLLIT